MTTPHESDEGRLAEASKAHFATARLYDYGGTYLPDAYEGFEGGFRSRDAEVSVLQERIERAEALLGGSVAVFESIAEELEGTPSAHLARQMAERIEADVAALTPTNEGGAG